MGLLDRLFGRQTKDGIEVPEPVTCEGGVNDVHAPASGEVISMADIPDPVFAAGAMGPALGIKPTDGIVYSPVTGEVTVTTGTQHALGLMSDSGIEILIHVGVDTVNMKGKGFVGFVEKGQRVRAGDALVQVDLAQVAEAGYDDTVITVITNANDLATIRPCETTHVNAGKTLMSIADE